VLVTVNVDVTAVAPVIAALVGFNAHVTGLVAPVGPVTAHVSATVPVYPFEGVTLTVEVLPVFVPAVTLRVVGASLSAKLGTATAFTVTVTCVVCVMVPSVPVTTNV
jgi:hypothetical protein